VEQVPRLNLVANPSFKNDTEYWEGIGEATIASDTSQAFYGDRSVVVTKSDVPSSGIALSVPIAVQPGQPYAVSSYVLVPITVPSTENATVSIRLRWLAYDGMPISETATVNRTVSPDERWIRISGLFVAPAGAASVALSIVQTLPGNKGAQFFVDAVLFEQSSYVGGYVENFSTAVKTATVNLALTPYQTRVIGGMKLQADVMLNNLILNTIDEDGVVWVCTDIEGWWGQAAPDVPDIARGVEDGSYNVSGRYTARQITLKGVFLPPDPSYIQKARNRLVAASNLVREGGWLRSNEEPTRAAFVRLAGRPEIETVNVRGRTEFSIDLKAADPIKYHWNDNDNAGFSKVTIPGYPGVGDVQNIGTADVTAIFELTGPLGSASTVTNTATNETITLVDMLRGDSNIGRVFRAELYDNVVTLTTSNPHGLIVGDKIVVYGLGSPFDTTADAYTVTAASNELPYTLSYEKKSPNVDEGPVEGSVSLARRDVLEIDTYEKSVTLNGNPIGQRARVETLIDWIKLAPGENTIVFSDNVKIVKVSHKNLQKGIITLKTEGTNYLVVGEQVKISFTETAQLVRKSLTDNKATLTTVDDHGISVGDIIDVASSETLNVVSKASSGTVATLTTDPLGGFAVGDNITVVLPTKTSISSKSAGNSVVRVGTVAPHGFSQGDSVAVEFRARMPVTTKAITGDLATLESSSAHGFSQGDSVEVLLPVMTNVIGKFTSSTQGSPVVLKTSAAHRFSVGDQVQIALPEQATMESASMVGDDFLVRVTTKTPHGFAVGDRVEIKTGNTTSWVVRQTYAGLEECILGLEGDAQDKLMPGDIIVVSGLGARFDGTFVADEVPFVNGSAVRYINPGGRYESTAARGLVYNRTVGQSYDGIKVITNVTPTTFTYSYYEGPEGTSPIWVSPTTSMIRNLTNIGINGIKTITATTPTQITYNR
jgi:hypothetical protein